MPNIEPVEKENLEVGRLRLEYERLRLERQKLAVETRLKRRELSQSRSKIFKDLLANPLSLAIVGGFLTLMTSIVTTWYTAAQNRDADDRRAKQAVETANENRMSDDRRAKQAVETELIKKFVEAPTDSVRVNLKFLVDANLLPDYAEGIKAYLKNNPGAAPSLGNSASPREQFDRRTPLVMRSLISDFGFTDFQAAGVVGNMAYETAGFRVLDEVSFGGGRGGIGYVMWTGPRRVEFEKFVQSNGFESTSHEANYGFLKQELKTTQNSVVDAVKSTTSIEEATRVFQDRFERSVDPNYKQRINWANLALNVFQKTSTADAP